MAWGQVLLKAYHKDNLTTIMLTGYPFVKITFCQCGLRKEVDMSGQGRGKSWFEICKVVIDDYGVQIGPHGLAVYACMVRIAECEHFEFEDIATLLGIEQSEVTSAVHKLITAGIVTCFTWTKSNGTTAPVYNLVDLHPQYYNMPLPMPKTEGEPEMPSIPTKPDKASPLCKGFVYVVEGEGYFKIGCTTNLNQRIKALTVKAPFDLVIHLVIPSLDIYRTEQELHRRFARKHRRGEWFNLDNKDIEAIRGDYQVIDPAFLSAE